MPPLHVQIHEQEVDVWRASLAVLEFARKDLQLVLTKEEIARAAHFRSEKERNHWMVARGMLRILLSRNVNTTPDQLQFCSNAYGKPFLAFPHKKMSMADLQAASQGEKNKKSLSQPFHFV
jgi:4'-phosphopantetheinyl transferase